jgi:hypothetical protein
LQIQCQATPPDKFAQRDLSFGKRRDAWVTRCRISDAILTVQRLHKFHSNLRLRYKTLAIRPLGKSTMAFVPLGIGRAMSVSGTLRLIKMNTLEPLLRDNRVNLEVDRTLTLRAPRRTPARSSIPVVRKKHWRLVVLMFLIPFVAIAGLVHLLRTVPSGLLQQEFEGLGAAICAVVCGGFLLWRVIRALDIDLSLQTQPSTISPSPFSSSEPNPAEPRKVQSSSPPDAATAHAALVASLPIRIRT